MPFKDKNARKWYDQKRRENPEIRKRRAEASARHKTENKDKILKRDAERRIFKRALVMVSSTRVRARKRKMDFDLDQPVEALQKRIDNGVCELSGQPFDLSPGRKFSSPSFDRINSKRGYTYDNVRIVLNILNVSLGDWGEEVLKDVLRKWLST